MSDFSIIFGNPNSTMFSANEQKYIDEVKDCLADGEITKTGRRLLNMHRERLGINESRAAELEASVTTPQLTDEEKEYLEAYQEANENGQISDKERRILNRLRDMLGITDERAKVIEKEYYHENIDYSILCKYLDNTDSCGTLNIDDTFLNSEESTINEKEKYGLSSIEKIGLVIIGKISNNPPITYTTVLSSKRFLLFCNSNKIQDFEWLKISFVSCSSESITFKFKDGSEYKIQDVFLGGDTDENNNKVSHKSKFFISLIKDKVHVKSCN